MTSCAIRSVIARGVTGLILPYVVLLTSNMLPFFRRCPFHVLLNLDDYAITHHFVVVICHSHRYLENSKLRLLLRQFMRKRTESRLRVLNLKLRLQLSQDILSLWLESKIKPLCETTRAIQVGRPKTLPRSPAHAC